MSAPVVVKLGGSLADAPELAGWLEALATAPGPARIIVPGGGPFADAVRAAQRALPFHDLAAHRMAILAMQQFGLLLQALEPRLALAETPADLAAPAAGTGAVWLPWRMIGRDTSIAASWDVTSDSLALLLARQLGARHLFLVKSARLPGGTASAASLADLGILDAAFPGLAEGYGGEIACAARSDACRLAAFLAGRPDGLLSVGTGGATS